MVRQALDLTPPHLYQAVLTDFIREGHFARHIRRLRLVYGERRTALVNSIRKEFGSSLEVLDQKPVCISPSRCPQDSAIRRLRRGPHTKNFGFGRFRLPMRARLPDRDSFWGSEARRRRCRTPSPSEESAHSGSETHLTKLKQWLQEHRMDWDTVQLASAICEHASPKFYAH